MKLRPVNNLDNRNMATSITINDDVMLEIMSSLDCAKLATVMANLEQSRSWILHGWSVKLRFSLIVDLYLKIEPKNL